MISLVGAVREADVLDIPDDLDALLDAAGRFDDAVGGVSQHTARASAAWSSLSDVVELTSTSGVLAPLMDPAHRGAVALADAASRFRDACGSIASELGRLQGDHRWLVGQVVAFRDGASSVASSYAARHVTSGGGGELWSWRDVPDLVTDEAGLCRLVDIHNSAVADALRQSARQIADIGAPSAAATPSSPVVSVGPTTAGGADSSKKQSKGHWWDHAWDTTKKLGTGAWHDVEDGAAVLGNGVLSFAQAMGDYPGDTLTMLGGLGLMSLGGSEEALGAALDCTVVGAIGGIPLNVVGGLTIAAGGGLALKGGSSLMQHAMTDDHVERFDTDHGRVPSEAPHDAASVKAKFETLKKGGSRKVRVVDSEADLDALYGELAEGGSPVDAPGYNGSWVALPDGTRIGLRTDSESGGPTIDIKYPDKVQRKVHIQ